MKNLVVILGNGFSIDFIQQMNKSEVEDVKNLFRLGHAVKTNQDHYCGEKPSNIDEYIAVQSEDVRTILAKVRETIRAAAPDAIEKISWSMPTFWQSENLIHFAAF